MDVLDYEQLSAGSEPLYTAQGTLNAGVIVALTPVMIDAINKQLVAWDKTPGKAVGVSAIAVDASVSPQPFPYYKSGCINTALIAWPDATTDDEKSVAFVGSALSVAALGL